jgi:5-hydroxyisourate hydrolase-like protein (transthyretin family)
MRFAAAFVLALMIGTGPLQSQTRPVTFEGTITLPNRNTAKPGSVSGTVVSETTGLPLAGATVTISLRRESSLIALLSGEEPGALAAPVTTDERGRFSFQRVAPGSYELTAKKEGYLEELPGQTQNPSATWVRLTSDERVDNIKVSLILSSRLEGRVRTETGQPAAGVPVVLIQSGPMNRVAQAKTSDDGSYRLDGFPTGDYVLIAGSPMVAEGETARSFAGPITITTSDTVKSDLTLDTKSYGIRGKLTLDLVNVPPASMDMTILSMAAPDTSPGPVAKAINILYSATTGAYDIPGLSPGLYRITALSTDPRADGLCAAEDVVVQRADIENVNMILMGCGK